MKIFKRVIFYVLSALFAALCVFLAMEGSWTGTSLIYIVNAPMENLGEFINELLSSGNVWGGWSLFAGVCFIPLIFPIIKIIVNRKFYGASISWLVLSLYLGAMLYLSVYPETIKIESAYGNAWRQIMSFGINFTFFAVLMISILCEFFSYSKSGKKVYSFAKFIIYAFAFGYIFSAFFLSTVSAKSNWVDISSSGSSDGFGGIFDSIFNPGSIITSPQPDEWSNILKNISVVCGLVFSYVRAIIYTILMEKFARALDMLKVDAFAHDNTKYLDGVIKLSKVAVFVTLGIMIVQNIFEIILSPTFTSTTYSIAFPIVELLVISLVMILAEMLKRAVEIKDENDLTV